MLRGVHDGGCRGEAQNARIWTTSILTNLKLPKSMPIGSSRVRCGARSVTWRGSLACRWAFRPSAWPVLGRPGGIIVACRLYRAAPATEAARRAWRSRRGGRGGRSGRSRAGPQAAIGSEEDWHLTALADGQVDCPCRARRERHYLAAFAGGHQSPVPALSAQGIPMPARVASERRSPREQRHSGCHRTGVRDAAGFTVLGHRSAVVTHLVR